MNRSGRAGQHPELLEDRELVPVLPQAAYAIVAELGDGHAAHRDAEPGRLDGRVATEPEHTRVDHAERPLDGGVVAPDVERRHLKRELREGAVTVVELVNELDTRRSRQGWRPGLDVVCVARLHRVPVAV